MCCWHSHDVEGPAATYHFLKEKRPSPNGAGSIQATLCMKSWACPIPHFPFLVWPTKMRAPMWPCPLYCNIGNPAIILKTEGPISPSQPCVKKIGLYETFPYLWLISSHCKRHVNQKRKCNTVNPFDSCGFNLFSAGWVYRRSIYESLAPFQDFSAALPYLISAHGTSFC